MNSMYTSFKEIETALLGKAPKRLALAAANDEVFIASVIKAAKRGLVDPILIGNTSIMKSLLTQMQENVADYTLIDCADESDAVNKACEMAKNGDADVIMKGLMQTATFMKAILNRDAYGFLSDKSLLSQATILEFDGRLLILTDCAVNISPNYNDKVKIINNAARLANKLGISYPKVAVIAPVEVVNPQIGATIDAAMLSKASQRGQIKSCIVDGPFGLDNALSKEAAEHKGIISNVAGQPDILLLPDLCTGNVLTKALVYFAKGLESCGTLLGTSIPVVMTSRTDTAQNKYYAILMSLL